MHFDPALNHLEIRTALILGTLYLVFLLIAMAHSRARKHKSSHDLEIGIVLAVMAMAQCFVVTPVVYNFSGFWFHDMAWTNAILTGSTAAVYFAFAAVKD